MSGSRNPGFQFLNQETGAAIHAADPAPNAWSACSEPSPLPVP